MQIICSEKTVRSNTVKDLEDSESQSLATQAKKRDQIVSMMPAIKKTFDLMADDMVEKSTKKEFLKNKMSSYDEKW